MKKRWQYSVRNVKYKYYLSKWILECENTRSYHLSHKTLKLFKLKFLTLSVRDIIMLIEFEICKIWSENPFEYHATVWLHIENYLVLQKNNDTRFDPRFTLVFPLCVHIHTYMYRYIYYYYCTHAHTYIYYYCCFCYCFWYCWNCYCYCYYIVYYSL